VTSEDLTPELGGLLASLTELPPSNDPAVVVAAALAARAAAPLQAPPADGEVAAFSRAVDDVQHTLRLLSNDDWALPAVNGLSVGELFDRIRSTMPLDRPGALSRETYADILSYVLKSNSYPAGASELSTRSEVLATIRMEANRPTGSGAAQPASIVPADPATSAK